MFLGNDCRRNLILPISYENFYIQKKYA